MGKITLKEYKKEFKEIKDFFNLPFYGTAENKNVIDTSWGEYQFYFDKDSIFGKFTKLKKENIPPRFQKVNGTVFEIQKYPNLYSGKMNFHFEDVFDFIDTIDRIKIYDVA